MIDQVRVSFSSLPHLSQFLSALLNLSPFSLQNTTSKLNLIFVCDIYFFRKKTQAISGRVMRQFLCNTAADKLINKDDDDFNFTISQQVF